MCGPLLLKPSSTTITLRWGCSRRNSPKNRRAAFRSLSFLPAPSCLVIMRAGRARWKIENETFNTLKNQGYNLGHNYGLGKKNLSAVFAILMMLAFLLDQIQQMSCWLFREAWTKAESKRYLWESIRAFFNNYRVDSMETILRAIAHGFERRELKEACIT